MSEQEIQELRERQNSLESEINFLRTRVDNKNNDEINEEQIINDRLLNLKDRPQILGNLENSKINDDLLRNLSIHELHKVKLYEKEHKHKSKTILDENLGNIFNNCINILENSYEGYDKSYNQSLDSLEIYDNYYDIKFFDKIKVHLLAVSLYLRNDENSLYFGLILIFVSIIIFLINILIYHDSSNN
jgi:hypothetical protein